MRRMRFFRYTGWSVSANVVMRCEKIACSADEMPAGIIIVPSSRCIFFDWRWSGIVMTRSDDAVISQGSSCTVTSAGAAAWHDSIARSIEEGAQHAIMPLSSAAQDPQIGLNAAIRRATNASHAVIFESCPVRLFMIMHMVAARRFLCCDLQHNYVIKVIKTRRWEWDPAPRHVFALSQLAWCMEPQEHSPLPVEQCSHVQSGSSLAQVQAILISFAGLVAGAPPADGFAGTRFMPHFGHFAFGSSIITSGCMGHVYFIPDTAGFVSLIIDAVSVAAAGSGCEAGAGATTASGVGAGGCVEPPQAETRIAEAIAITNKPFFMETSIDFIDSFMRDALPSAISRPDKWRGTQSAPSRRT